jgi:hypothetical protein
VVASLIVGTILARFSITTDEPMKAAGPSSERVEELARAGLAGRCRPGLGSLVIVAIWFVFYLSGRQAESGLIGRYLRSGAPFAPVSLARSEAAITATPTTPTMMLHTAFISGFTPKRTSE